MITGTVSITGVVISSIIAKIVDYRFNVKKLLYDKREVPYEQFIEMVYSIMEDTKKPENKRMTEEEINKKVSEFSRGLTLWGSNRVVKKWIKYRKNAAKNPDNENLFLLEQILYEMRKDVGLRRKMKKGVMLSFFINDIENALKKQLQIKKAIYFDITQCYINIVVLVFDNDYGLTDKGNLSIIYAQDQVRKRTTPWPFFLEKI